MLQHRVKLLAVPASCNETECWPVSNPEYTYSIMAGVWIAPWKTQTQIMFLGFNVRNCSKPIFFFFQLNPQPATVQSLGLLCECILCQMFLYVYRILAT